MYFNFRETLSATFVLMAVMDILGSLPIVLSMKEKGIKINALQISVVVLAFMLVFMLGGPAMLSLYGVDINSFALAGAIVLFIIGLEMLLGADFFKQDGPKSASIVPLAFPLLAGPGSFSTILSLQAEYSLVNVIIALVLNVIFIFVVLKGAPFIHNLIGRNGIYIMKKFFSVILLAMAIKMFTSNLAIIIEKF